MLLEKKLYRLKNIQTARVSTMKQKNKQSRKEKIKRFLKKRAPLWVFLSLATVIFFLSSTLLMGESYKDIVLIAMIWALPLFIH